MVILLDPTSGKILIDPLTSQWSITRGWATFDMSIIQVKKQTNNEQRIQQRLHKSNINISLTGCAWDMFVCKAGILAFADF